MTDFNSRFDDGLRKYKGWIGEIASKARDYSYGYEIQDTGVGSDYKRRKINYITNKKGQFQYIEKKTGGTLTRRQKEERKKRGKQFIVDTSKWY